ncbi:hypothetical protein BDV12DRAFT_191868 [Aspergillus spectabilis]
MRLTRGFGGGQYMHDENCTLGLDIANAHGETWTAFGEKRLLLPVNKENLQRCSDAAEQSVLELVTAFNTKLTVQPNKLEALNLAPTRASAEAENIAPLFKPGAKQKRVDIKDRKSFGFTSNYDAKTTLDECEKSGLWKQPIHLNALVQGVAYMYSRLPIGADVILRRTDNRKIVYRDLDNLIYFLNL